MVRKWPKELLDIISQRKSGNPTDGEGNPFPRWRKAGSVNMNMPVIWWGVPFRRRPRKNNSEVKTTGEMRLDGEKRVECASGYTRLTTIGLSGTLLEKNLPPGA